MNDKREISAYPYIQWTSNQGNASLTLVSDTQRFVFNVDFDDFSCFLDIIRIDCPDKTAVLSSEGRYDFKQRYSLLELKHRVLIALIPEFDQEIKKLVTAIKQDLSQYDIEKTTDSFCGKVLSVLDKPSSFAVFFALVHAKNEAKGLLKQQNSLSIAGKMACDSLIKQHTAWSKTLLSRKTKANESSPAWLRFRDYAFELGFSEQCALISSSHSPDLLTKKDFIRLLDKMPGYLLYNQALYFVDDEFMCIRLEPENMTATFDLSMFPQALDTKTIATATQLAMITSLTGHAHRKKQTPVAVAPPLSKRFRDNTQQSSVKCLPDMLYDDIKMRCQRFLYGDMLGLSISNKLLCARALHKKLSDIYARFCENDRDLDYKDPTIPYFLYWRINSLSSPVEMDKEERIKHFENNITYVWYSGHIYLIDAFSNCHALKASNQKLDDVFDIPPGLLIPASLVARELIEKECPHEHYSKLKMSTFVQTTSGIVQEVAKNIDSRMDLNPHILLATDASQYYWALPGRLARFVESSLITAIAADGQGADLLTFCDRMPNPDTLLTALFLDSSNKLTTPLRAQQCFKIIALLSSIYPYVIQRNSKYIKTPVAVSAMLENILQMNIQGAAHGPKLKTQEKALNDLVQELMNIHHNTNESLLQSSIECWIDYISIHQMLGDLAKSLEYTGEVGQRGATHGCFLQTNLEKVCITPSEIDAWVTRRIQAIRAEKQLPIVLTLTERQQKATRYCVFPDPERDPQQYTESVNNVRLSLSRIAQTLGISVETFSTMQARYCTESDVFISCLLAATGKCHSSSQNNYELSDFVQEIFEGMFRKIVPTHFMQPTSEPEAPQPPKKIERTISGGGRVWGLFGALTKPLCYGSAILEPNVCRPGL